MKSVELMVWAYTLAALAGAAYLGCHINDSADIVSLLCLLGMTAFVQWNYWRED